MQRIRDWQEEKTMTVVFKAPNSMRLYHLLMLRWSLRDFPGGSSRHQIPWGCIIFSWWDDHWVASLAVQRVRLLLPVQKVQGRSLVRKLRSHMPCNQKNKNVKQKQYCNKFKKDFKKWSMSKKKKTITEMERMEIGLYLICLGSL